ncbi:MAG: hypothetical protein FWB82_00840 [Treponema sp.]|nr:hypothetical protein [Treponema sp.]
MRKVSFLLASGLFQRRYAKFILIVFFTVMVSGCSGGRSTTITGQARQSIAPSQVYLFISRPLQYEVIGIVETSRRIVFSRYAAWDRAKNDLKRQAAEIGANGVLELHGGSRTGGGLFFRTVTTQMKALHVTR